MENTLKGKSLETRYKLANALKELMRHEALEKISVKQIVSKAGLTRQTFYRNFLDKYDLVNWYFEELVKKSFKQMGVKLTLREGLIEKFGFIKAERAFFSQAFLYEKSNSLIEYDYQCIYQFYYNIIAAKNAEALDKETVFLLKMYCKGSIDMTVDWVANGMSDDIEATVDLLIEAMPKRLENLLKDLR